MKSQIINRTSPTRCQTKPAASGTWCAVFRKTQCLQESGLVTLQPQWPLSMRPCQSPVDRHIVSSTSAWAFPLPKTQKQDQCEGRSPYFCWRMAVVLSRAQPGRMMPNFPGTDKSTTVEPRRYSGLWPFPIGPPSMTRDN